MMRSRVSQMSFDLGDLRSHRKPMRCVIGNWPLDFKDVVARDLLVTM